MMEFQQGLLYSHRKNSELSQIFTPIEVVKNSGPFKKYVVFMKDPKGLYMPALAVFYETWPVCKESYISISTTATEDLIELFRLWEKGKCLVTWLQFVFERITILECERRRLLEVAASL